MNPASVNASSNLCELLCVQLMTEAILRPDADGGAHRHWRRIRARFQYGCESTGKGGWIAHRYELSGRDILENLTWARWAVRRDNGDFAGEGFNEDEPETFIV